MIISIFHNAAHISDDGFHWICVLSNFTVLLQDDIKFKDLSSFCMYKFKQNIIVFVADFFYQLKGKRNTFRELYMRLTHVLLEYGYDEFCNFALRTYTLRINKPE